MLKTFNRAVAAVCATAILTGCATTEDSGSGRPRTAMDRAIGQCALAVGVGAILGAAVGNNSGHHRGNAGRGAATGALVGAGVCVVLLAMAHEKDKQQLASAQLAALASGRSQTVRYSGDDNSARVIRVSAPVTAPDPLATKGGTRICRAVNSHLSVSGVGESEAPQQIWCRDANGDYAPA